MPFAMCSDGGERSADFDCTIHQNEVVVTDVTKATLPMPPAHIVHIDMRQLFGGSAMDDDRIDYAHRLDSLQVLHSLFTVLSETGSLLQSGKTLVKKVDSIDENLISETGCICLRFLAQCPYRKDLNKRCATQYSGQDRKNNF
jgi:hypothetical protein